MNVGCCSATISGDKLAQQVELKGDKGVRRVSAGLLGGQVLADGSATVFEACASPAEHAEPGLTDLLSRCLSRSFSKSGGCMWLTPATEVLSLAATTVPEGQRAATWQLLATPKSLSRIGIEGLVWISWHMAGVQSRSISIGNTSCSIWKCDYLGLSAMLSRYRSVNS